MTSFPSTVDRVLRRFAQVPFVRTSGRAYPPGFILLAHIFAIPGIGLRYARFLAAGLLGTVVLLGPMTAVAQTVRVKLTPAMIIAEPDCGNPQAMVDEQDAVGDPPSGEPQSAWSVEWGFWKSGRPLQAELDLGRVRNLSDLWIFDTFNIGPLKISVGEPGKWTSVAAVQTDRFMSWVQIPLPVSTRYLRLTRTDGASIFSEIALYEYTPEGYQDMLVRKAAAAKACLDREAALEKARQEAANRALVDLGSPFGKLSLVDEVDCSATDHLFSEAPAGSSRVEEILGRSCRVLNALPDQSTRFTYRLGRFKLLQPGRRYLLTVEYPEDAPRTVIVMNGGNETSRGFHTGPTFGDAFHPKYVNNNNESLEVPLSGRYETWISLFHLHDRTPDTTFLRGEGLRGLTAEDGFTVTIAQFSAPNIPLSLGAAVRRIRLFEVPDGLDVGAQYIPVPEGLPRRHLFWREEMADGVIASKKEEERGLRQRLDWYRFKADTMRYLGINTYTKDLLEFGACQGWDSTDGGGNQWVFFDGDQKDLWPRIVELMGQAGFDILPYYEYSGSKGYQGLGNQRRARPLTRDDAYTHIGWIESANADLTDPETLADFRKMLDLTIVRHKDKASFVGAWLRPRAQLPIGFADATRARFADELHGGRGVTRKELIDDPQLLARYCDWWYGKRREFLVAVRDHLRAAGVNSEASVLFTAVMGEPGPSFPTWDKIFVTDHVPLWNGLLKDPAVSLGEDIRPTDLLDVVRKGRYLEALLAPPLNWGDWEVHHSSPPPDPQRYQQTEGVLMTHAFNRAYTVGSPETFDAFRGPAGLAIVRHYTLNENMMFDSQDKEQVGYFVADVERAGPYCMLAEARAMAYGDPTYVGYLVGNNFSRGFPEYVRAFNTAFLSLPALPSRVLPDASSDPDVVVRAIETPANGTYLAVVNTALVPKPSVRITLPAPGRLSDGVTGEALTAEGGLATVSLYPCQLRALRLQE
ncbi:MAG: hypothetical protein ACYC6Y_01380 [Thermoguttaceae bacterium]